GLTVHRETAEQLVHRKAQFSAVTFVDVLEHIPNPVAVLRSVHDLLPPSGVVAVQSPFGRRQLLKERLRHWWRKGYPAHIATNMIHVNHFDPHSLGLALTKSGFKNVRVYVAVPVMPSRWPAQGFFNGLVRLGVH